ncbi:MAG: aspartate carbamoyltransferase regulatory subunit [Eubacteriales bacterium]
MMNIDGIFSGIVLDHIEGGMGLQIYHDLALDKLDCSIAIIQNVKSQKMGKKDIIKIDDDYKINFDDLAYIDPNITVSVIRNGQVDEKVILRQPERIVNIQDCKNPRCITSIEQELEQVFLLTDPEKGIYRCQYCEAIAQRKK